MSTTLRNPSLEETKSPMFNAIWEAIKQWDMRRSRDAHYSEATGTDVCTILDAIGRVPDSAEWWRGVAQKLGAELHHEHAIATEMLETLEQIANECRIHAMNPHVHDKTDSLLSISEWASRAARKARGVR